MPVPRAAVLTVDAYRHAVKFGALDDFLATLPERVEPDALEAEAARVDDAFRAVSLPDDLVAAIRDAYALAGRGGRVSVRSSATAEDRMGASFAGQYRSFLDVEAEDVETAARLCWASLWAPAARAYRRAEGIDETDLAMAVIIQQMIESERSGVVFTADPTTSNSDDVRVEVVDGLGERLVSGEATPEVFHARRADRRAIEPNAPVFLGELVDYALAIEDVFDAPQDVEWAVAEGTTYILQARPITTLAVGTDDAFETTGMEGALFTPVGVAEMLPGVLPPLLWTMNAPMVEEAFHTLFATLGVPADTRQMLGRFHGRAALNLSALKSASQKLGGSGEEVERQYLGRAVSTEDDSARRAGSRARRLRTGFKAIRLRRKAAKNNDIFLEALDILSSLGLEYAEVPSEMLVEYRRRLRDVARHGIRTEVWVSSVATADYHSLELSLGRVVGVAGAALAAQRLTAGAIGDETEAFAPVQAVWESHDDASELDQIAQAIDEGPIEATDARLHELGPAGDWFVKDVDERLRRAGSRALYGGETWAEQRTEVWAASRRARGLTPDRSLASGGMADASSEAAKYLIELNDQLRRNRRVKRFLTGQVIDMRRRHLRRSVANTTTFLHMREAAKAAVLRLGGEERRVVNELARRLVRVGYLDHVDDVELLTDDELDRMAVGESGATKHELARRRVRLRAAQTTAALPEVFEGAPDAAPSATAERIDSDEKVLSGWATSPGRVTGRARVVNTLSDARDLVHGEILVGRSTDPSWTPLFLVAAGIVMEQGGPLSHAAIIARELRLPAVLNVGGATRRIATGTALSVDGTAGTVEILEGDENEETS
jgi:pyruvate,water dikinase